jgi:methylmalonyl-CoA/ethylmalonyl-CoA epimerase
MSSTVRTSSVKEWALGASPFHHVGFVVGSIAQTAREFAESIGANWDAIVIHDPLQAVRVTLLRPSVPQNPVVELVEPAGDDSPVIGFLKRGGGLHHFCYEVTELERQLEVARSLGMLIAKMPQPAAAFGGRRIAWVYTKQRLLLELLEK